MIFVISGALLIQMLGEGEMSAMSMPKYRVLPQRQRGRSEAQPLLSPSASAPSTTLSTVLQACKYALQNCEE
jgi:hypothetical protein